MKVTALLPDKLIEEVRILSGGKTITESLKVALNEWVKIQNLKVLNEEVREKPLEFVRSADELRELNRTER